MSKVKVKLKEDDVKNFVHQVNEKGIDYSSTRNGDDFTFTIESASIGSLLNSMGKDLIKSQDDFEKEKDKVIKLDEENNTHVAEIKALKEDLDSKTRELSKTVKCPIEELETAVSEPETPVKSNFFPGFLVGAMAIFGVLLLV